MVTPELANFIKIELERNISHADITAKLVSAGWLLEDVAEALTQAKISNTNIQPEVPKTNVQEPIQPKVSSFDPYKEPTSTPVTTFTYKPPVEKTAPIVPPLMPELIPKALGDTQNSISNIPMTAPKVAEAPKLELYQNKIEKIVPPATFTPPVAIPQKRHHYLLRTLTVIIVILFLVGGGFYSYTKGYIKLPFDVPFLKKDPHQILSQLPSKMTDVKSFKSVVDVKATFPALSQIIGMLMGGESSPTTNTDTISLNTVILYDENSSSDKKSDIVFNGTSTLIDESISINLRKIGDTMYVKPLSGQGLIPKGINLPIDWISLSKSDLESLYKDAAIKENIALQAENKDAISNVFSNSNWANIMKTLPIDSTTVIKENPEEKISGVDTYHYSIAIDPTLTKNIIHSIANAYGFKASDADWVKIDQATSSVIVNNFDLWIGKEDNLLYKSQIIITVPLTKVLNIEDKNLSENNLKLEFLNTFSDYNLPVDITAPENSTSILKIYEEMNKSMEDQSLKNIMSDLAVSFGDLHNVEKIYGYKSNTTGDCANPLGGSLFSPIGHKKLASTAVSDIAQNIIAFMGKGSGTAACYSTPYAWAIAKAKITDNTKYFCSDSTGSFIETSILLSGPVCK